MQLSHVLSTRHPAKGDAAALNSSISSAELCRLELLLEPPSQQQGMGGKSILVALSCLRALLSVSLSGFPERFGAGQCV